MTELDRMLRDTILVKGRVTSDNRFWFNEEIATMFCIKMNTKINIGATSFRWVDTTYTVVDVTIDEAKAYAAEIMDTLDAAYSVSLTEDQPEPEEPEEPAQ